MQSNLLASLSVKQLKRAVAVRGRIEALQKTLSRILGNLSAAGTATSRSKSKSKSKSPGRRKKRRMSAAARARISAAAKARWARFRKDKAGK